MKSDMRRDSELYKCQVAKEAILRELSETEKELSAAREEVERLKQLVYIPGILKCKKCDFRLIKSTLHVMDGKVTADNAPDNCPNCNVPMWKVSFKDDYKDTMDRFDKYDELEKQHEQTIRELRAENNIFRSFAAAYIKWAVSDEQCGGELFDAMVKAYEPVDDLATKALKGKR